jgi:hypothetical protein
MLSKYYKKNVPKKYRKLGKQSRYPSSFGQLAKRIAYVKSLLNVETKTIDQFNTLNSAVGTVDTTFAPTAFLNTLSQGPQENQRVGNSMKCKQINLRLMFNANTASNVPQNIRVLLVQDLNRNAQADGSDGPQPTLGTVLRPDVPTTGQVNNVMAYLNDNTSGRYKIVMNKMFTLDRTSTAGVCINKSFKMDHDIKWASNAQTNPINGYYLWYFTDNSAFSNTNLPRVTGFVRIKYIDN